MDNSDRLTNRQNDLFGVNKMGKNIKKSPIHQPNFANAARQPRPQVYNINKNDFRSVVQQLTGSPAREPPSQPPQNLPKLPGNRLHRIRPPPLPIHSPGPVRAPVQPPVMAATPTSDSPVSAYMRYLQNSMTDSGTWRHSVPMNGDLPRPSPCGNGPPPPLPSPRIGGPPPLLPLQSPGFSFSPMAQFGLLSPGPQASPGYGFPLSPSGFFPISSPRWRDQ